MTLFGFFILLFFVLGISPAFTKVPAVFMFGDSIVDTGNNNYIDTIAKSNFPPYGKDFMGGKPTGRFSNGKVPADFFVEELGIKELLPPYLDPSLTQEDLVTGVNFASGAAGYDPLTSELARVISPSDQLKLFEEYVVKLEGIVGEERRSIILNNSLFMVVFGSNDITNTYFSIPVRRSQYDVSSYSDFLVSYASNFVKGLYGAGARRICVFGVPPVGCVPSQRTLAGGPQRTCVEKYNEAVEVYNSKLSAELKSLDASLSDAIILYVDIYNLPLDLIHNPVRYGYKISDRGCCGTGEIEVAFLCAVGCGTCDDVAEYVFWDSFHLTEKAYALLAHRVFAQYLSSYS